MKPESHPINRAIGEMPRLDYLPVSAIRVDDSYQRPVKARRIQQILRDFTWAQFGALMVVDQGDGTYTVYDGQHRLRAAQKHPDITEVPAIIVELDAAREEAEAFLGVNVNRSAISTVEKYWAGIEAGDEAMMRVCAVLEEAGCEVVPPGKESPAANRTKAITAIERALRAYGDEAVTLACKTLVAAWPKDRQALNGTVIQGLARLYRHNKDVIQIDRMVTKLHGKDRKILSGDIDAMRKVGGGDPALACAKTLLEIYNRQLTTNLIRLGTR